MMFCKTSLRKERIYERNIICIFKFGTVVNGCSIPKAGNALQEVCVCVCGCASMCVGSDVVSLVVRDSENTFFFFLFRRVVAVRVAA